MHTAPEGDVRFPDVDPGLFRLVHREDHAAGPDDEVAFTYLDYVRR